MSVEIGKVQTLEVIRAASAGWYLVGDEELGEILLPNCYVPDNIDDLEEIEVFVYCDSEDRPVATTERPIAQVGEFACMEVKDVHPRAGAFLDWGLPKDLLLPYREQPKQVSVGEHVVVMVKLDERSGRLVATRRFDRYLNSFKFDHALGDEVVALVYEKTPLGYNAIVESQWKGLIYSAEAGRPLKIGEKLRVFVRELRPEGKIDLALNQSGYNRVAPLCDLIIEALRDNGGKLAFSDKSDPELIRDAFDVSKKAFKQALGTLYKERKIRFESPGIVLAE